MRRFRSFNHNTCNRVLNLLQAIYLRLMKTVVERVKLHWHLHAFWSRNVTQCAVAMRAISAARSVAWSGVRVLFALSLHTHQIRTVYAMREQNDRNRHAMERLVYAYFPPSLRTSTDCPDDFAHAWIRRGIFGARSRFAAHSVGFTFISTNCGWFNTLNTRDSVVAEQRTCLYLVAAGLLHLEEQEKRQHEQNEGLETEYNPI